MANEIPSNLPSPQPGTPPAKGVKRVAQNIKAPTRRILLEQNDDIPPTGLFMGYNGYSYMLRAGEWVDVPMPLIEILDNAVQQSPVIDPNTRQIIDWRPKLRYPYRTMPNADAA